MRMYQPAWRQLKAKQEITIAAHPVLHPRIYKAIIKEKWLDSLYQVEQDFIGYRTKLSKCSDGNALTIRLHLIPSTPETLF